MNAKVQRNARTPYVVVTGDIVSSRRVARRAALQARLRELLARVQHGCAYGQLIVVPLTISGGDEFQGVAKPDPSVPGLLRQLTQGLLPVEVRVGIGLGTISTGLAERAQEMDGEAFIRSRQAVEEARRNDAHLWFVTGDGAFDRAANVICLLLRAIRRRWTTLHWRRAALRDQGLTESRIARREGVSQVAVHFSLARAAYPEVADAEQALADLWRGLIVK